MCSAYDIHFYPSFRVSPAPPRPAGLLPPTHPHPLPPPDRDGARAQRLRLQLRGALPDTRWSFRVQRSPPSFHPVGGGPRPCGRAPRSPPRAQAGTEAGPSRVRGLGAPRARPRGRLCLRFFHQGWRVNCNLGVLGPRRARGRGDARAQERTAGTHSSGGGSPALCGPRPRSFPAARSRAPTVLAVGGPRSLARPLPRPFWGALLPSSCLSSVIAPAHPTVCSPYTQGAVLHGSAGAGLASKRGCR